MALDRFSLVDINQHVGCGIRIGHQKFQSYPLSIFEPCRPDVQIDWCFLHGLAAREA